jgi:hypothetical protein
MKRQGRRNPFRRKRFENSSTKSAFDRALSPGDDTSREVPLAQDFEGKSLVYVC